MCQQLCHRICESRIEWYFKETWMKVSITRSSFKLTNDPLSTWVCAYFSRLNLDPTIQLDPIEVKSLVYRKLIAG